jgi:TPP-dependent 2-oxoacid decarboxylase
LDYLPACGLRWVGSVNELNAGEFKYHTLIG